MAARQLRGPPEPPLSPAARIVLAEILKSPGMTAAEITMATGINIRTTRQIATETLNYRGLVDMERAPGRGNSLGAYVLRFYPTAKAKAGDNAPANGA